ncbi:MAG: hypothetical protein HY906_23285 [Deltaproteobacteria bacterium]|nr:hypothetical protein [Deltaproteobacteria bacterium]
MKRQALKYLPIAVGLGLAWVLCNPPAFFARLGTAGFLATIALVGVLFLAFMVCYVFVVALPKMVQLEPVPDAPLDPTLGALARRIASLGLAPADPPLRVSRPPALMVPFVEETEGIYAYAYKLDSIQATVAVDFVSRLAGGRGGLTSTNAPSGAVSPARPGILRQVFANAAAEEVYARHREALAFLRGQGIAVDAVSAAGFPASFRESLAEQRAAFVRSPLRWTVVSLWRGLAGSSPYRGPVQGQRDTADQVRYLRGG